MKDLTIIKYGDAAYIDSREVAAAIGKRHDNLLRDIEGYLRILEKSGVLNFEGTSFFIASNYIDSWNRVKPCYLISRRGADIIAHKLTGEKGVLFTAAYVTKFHELSEREREREIAEIKAKSATTRLKVFNSAVRNVLSGYAQTCASSDDIMSFLNDAYKPFGISVAGYDGHRCTLTVTEIAGLIGIFSEMGRPHGHAVSAIIEKLNISLGHIEIAPYGLVGITVRYDDAVLFAVDDWLEANGYPRDIPHLDFEYHIVYRRSPWWCGNHPDCGE